MLFLFQQEKRLAFLDMTEFQEAQFEYKKSCRELAMCKEQLGKYKAKQSFLIQKIAKLKVLILRLMCCKYVFFFTITF